jgi:CheY-specific phosphatase CheX
MENTKKIKEMLTTSIFEVFEKMFFTFLEPLDEDEADWDFDAVAAIKFTGPQQGNMVIYLTNGLAATMVENMLNIGSDEVSDALIMDISKEGMNMICGNFLRKLDLSKVFDLTIPIFEKKAGKYLMKTAAQEDIRLGFDSDGEKMGIVLTFNN